jgi:hypothetical protein
LAADDILEGRLSIFNYIDELTDPSSFWNVDPLTGVQAPDIFWRSVDINSKSLVGDIKYLWEKNRHLHLVSLAQAYRLSGERKYLEGIRGQVDSWLEQCPYLIGPNWASGLELAIRLINWSITWQLIGAERSELFEDEDGQMFLDRWLQSIYQHTHFISGHYSGFSSANNHLVGEASGVFVATCTWPFWRQFESWQEKAKRLLIDAAENQVTNDGVDKEQAISYQQFVLEFFILSGLAGRAREVEFPHNYWHSIEKMIEFIREVMDVNGNVPMIGDADDGFVTGLSQEPDYCPYKSLLATGAILFNRPDFATKGGKLDDKTRYLLGGEGFSTLVKEGSRQRYAKRRQFPDGGYYILGQDFDTNREIFLLADAGPLGYLSIAAHGHADALAIYLSVGGSEFLVDPGTYTYHGAAEWREYFRSTRAHNTVVVDGQDQSVQGGPFLWTRHANALCTEFESGSDSDLFVGEHDGYKRLRDPVIHQRRIVRSGPEFELADTLKCAGKHSIERCWHFSEHCNVSIEGSTVIAENGGIKIELVADDPSTQLYSLAGSDRPIGGWVSRNYDVKVASTSVYFRDEIIGTSTLKAQISCHVPGLELD